MWKPRIKSPWEKIKETSWALTDKMTAATDSIAKVSGDIAEAAKMDVDVLAVDAKWKLRQSKEDTEEAMNEMPDALADLDVMLAAQEAKAKAEGVLILHCLAALRPSAVAAWQRP